MEFVRRKQVMTEEELKRYKARLLSLKARSNLIPLQDWMREALEILLQVRQEVQEKQERAWQSSN